MPVLEKLKLNKDFKRLYHRGRSYVTPYFVIYTMKSRTGKVRLGITVSKKLGGAVKRNRAKRVVTAAVRACLPNIREGNDFVVVARSRILTVKSTVAAEALKKQLRSAGLWNETSDTSIAD